MFNYYNPYSMYIPICFCFNPNQTMIPIKHNYLNNIKGNDEDLKNLYPKIYFKIYPLVKEHCDIIEKEKGENHCPSKKEVDTVCKKIYEKIKPQLDDDDEYKDFYRQHRYRRRHAVRDIIGILLINELLGRRRKRRYYNYYDYNYNYDNNYDDDYDYFD
ncbi:hypothetical protein [Clostridium tepidum]|uniref:Uncharacterized protein n=1 Tax=Clostridium tepidum TaxID=1962263 RepID=A0A1S9I4N1_9CLOT|nr:hypothetical protein [Clostridium tepidum]OOO62419.1 hypothetical protein BS637_06135 [Clostridium tepidum]OOO65246.1 hypothetical protein BS638_08900 [Clostridium tepidum]